MVGERNGKKKLRRGKGKGKGRERKQSERKGYTLRPSQMPCLCAFTDGCLLEKKHIENPCNISELEGEITDVC